MTGFNVCHWARYITHFWFVVELGFYSDMVECLPVDPATWVPFWAWRGCNIFALRHILVQNFVHDYPQGLWTSVLVW